MFGEPATARDVMHSGARSVRSEHSALEVARIMSEGAVGVVPVCEPHGGITGVITDRDLTRTVLAGERDPRTYSAGELCQDKPITAEADDSARQVLTTMIRHRLRRLPVIERDQLVGMISVADVAQAVPNPEVGDLVEALSAE